MANKLNATILDKSVSDILAFSEGETVKINNEEKKGKKRNSIETVELHISLKNYDPRREKRFSGTFHLPTILRPKISCCILSCAAHCE
jgi:large subunit ribosomal protein L10Ae